jgi:hypothetical protein
MIINNESYCVGIITFSKRKNYIENLISDIRSQNIIPIYLAINCDYNQPFDNDYRKFILNLCLQYDNIYPSFYLKFRGSAKIWNDIIINSSYDNILILNDDGRVRNNFINDIIDYKVSTNNDTILKTNNGWSSFVVNKKYIQSIGYFNEYYIGIGFEDNELVRRVGEFPSFNSKDWEDLHHESKNTFPKNEENQDEKQYSSFNRNLFSTDFTPPTLETSFRPYESFYEENYNKIFD